MPAPNFMLQDLGAVSLGILLFGLLILPLGYTAAYLTDVAGFRERPRSIRLMLSLALGIGLSPVLSYLSAKAFGFRGTWFCYGLVWAVWLIVLGRSGRWRDYLRWTRFENRHQAICCGAMLFWTVVSVLFLIDLQIGDRLYFSVQAFDHGMRSAITRSITETGVPPDNPYYRPFHPVPLRYHYGWLLICSLADQLGGAAVDGRQAVLSSVAWPGLALFCLFPLYFYFVYGDRDLPLWKKSSLSIGLLSVTGLDLVPTLLVYSLTRGLFPEMEWWNNQVPAWIGSLLWVPHHMAALCAVLTGFLLVWCSRGKPARQVAAGGLLAGGCFASAGITSVYLAFGAAVFCAAWMAVWVLRGWKRELAPLLVAGGTAAALGAPYLMEVLRAEGTGSGGFIQFAVRRFYVVDWVLSAQNAESGWVAEAVHLLMLPFNYFLEFGFFYLIVSEYLKARKGRGMTPAQLTTAILLFSSLILATFFRSAMITHNDLGWRVIALSQFALIFWSVEVLEKWTRVGWTARILLAFGILGSLYELGLSRTYLPLADKGLVEPWMAMDRNVGERTLEQRIIYSQLKSRFPGARTVQHDAMIQHDDHASALYSPLPVVTEHYLCSAVMGGDDRACQEIAATLKDIYLGRPGLTVEEVNARGRGIGVDLLLVTDLDPAWNQPSSWVWKTQPAIQSRRVRVFQLPAAGGPQGSDDRQKISRSPALP